MSLDKAIKYKKEKRKQYYDSRSWDGSCRCHGSCPYCSNGRQHFDRKKRIDADPNEHFEEYLEEENAQLICH